MSIAWGPDPLPPCHPDARLTKAGGSSVSWCTTCGNTYRPGEITRRELGVG